MPDMGGPCYILCSNQPRKFVQCPLCAAWLGCILSCDLCSLFLDTFWEALSGGVSKLCKSEEAKYTLFMSSYGRGNSYFLTLQCQMGLIDLVQQTQGVGGGLWSFWEIFWHCSKWEDTSPEKCPSICGVGYMQIWGCLSRILVLSLPFCFCQEKRVKQELDAERIKPPPVLVFGGERIGLSQTVRKGLTGKRFATIITPLVSIFNR